VAEASGPGAGEKPVVLRMKLGFDTVAQFEAGYARFVHPKGIFLASRNPRAVGSLIRFELQTRGGERLMVAEGRVTSIRRSDPAEPRRVPGMHLRFTRLSRESKERLAIMLDASDEEDRSETMAPEAPEPIHPVDAADDVAPPAPAPIPSGLEAGAEGPLHLPDPTDSPFPAYFEELLGPRAEGERAYDPFADGGRADLPTRDGKALVDVPAIPDEAIIDI
jgi:hypothetical protein